MLSDPLYKLKLSNRKAETAAQYIRSMGYDATTAMCRSRSPMEIAENVLGSRASKAKIETLAKGILERVAPELIATEK